jgi:hypothetical protein
VNILARMANQHTAAHQLLHLCSGLTLNPNTASAALQRQISGGARVQPTPQLFPFTITIASAHQRNVFAQALQSSLTACWAWLPVMAHQQVPSKQRYITPHALQAVQLKTMCHNSQVDTQPQQPKKEKARTTHGNCATVKVQVATTHCNMPPQRQRSRFRVETIYRAADPLLLPCTPLSTGSSALNRQLKLPCSCWS